MQVPSRKRPTTARECSSEKLQVFPQSPVQVPNRKRPPFAHRDSSNDSLSTLELTNLEIDAWAESGGSGLPQSPVSFPSRMRPPGADDGWTGAPSETFCPQSPVSFPSRRMPFGNVRVPSRADSLSGYAPSAALDGIVLLEHDEQFE